MFNTLASWVAIELLNRYLRPTILVSVLNLRLFCFQKLNIPTWCEFLARGFVLRSRSTAPRTSTTSCGSAGTTIRSWDPSSRRSGSGFRKSWTRRRSGGTRRPLRGRGPPSRTSSSPTPGMSRCRRCRRGAPPASSATLFFATRARIRTF